MIYMSPMQLLTNGAFLYCSIVARVHFFWLTLMHWEEYYLVHVLHT